MIISINAHVTTYKTHLNLWLPIYGINDQKYTLYEKMLIKIKDRCEKIFDLNLPII